MLPSFFVAHALTTCYNVCMIKPRNKICFECSCIFLQKDARTRFCSLKCSSRHNADNGKTITRYWLGKTKPIDIVEKSAQKLRGRKLSQSHKNNISNSLISLHDKIPKQLNYRDIHKWVERRLGKANKCEHCGISQIPKGRKRYFQWSNISKRYIMNLNDWQQLCCKCHKKYDS